MTAEDYAIEDDGFPACAGIDLMDMRLPDYKRLQDAVQDFCG